MSAASELQNRVVPLQAIDGDPARVDAALRQPLLGSAAPAVMAQEVQGLGRLAPAQNQFSSTSRICAVTGSTSISTSSPFGATASTPLWFHSTSKSLMFV